MAKLIVSRQNMEKYEWVKGDVAIEVMYNSGESGYYPALLILKEGEDFTVAYPSAIKVSPHR